jgi:hypothetical protein
MNIDDDYERQKLCTPFVFSARYFWKVSKLKHGLAFFLKSQEIDCFLGH